MKDKKKCPICKRRIVAVKFFKNPYFDEEMCKTCNVKIRNQKFYELALEISNNIQNTPIVYK